MTSTTEYEMITSFKRLKSVVKHCAKEGHTALDFETTSLIPAEGRVRLVSLCNTKVSALVDFDRIRGGFKKCAKLFEQGTWIVFYSGFEMRWFMDAGAEPTIYDVGYLRRAILGGGRFKLAQIALWDLGYEMSKEEQASDWAAPVLRQEQLDYAYLDADITWRLWEHWSQQADPGRWTAFHMFNSMVPGVIEMEDTGMAIDIKQHKILCQRWADIKDEKLAKIREMVGVDEVENINSGPQWSDYFARTMPDHITRAWPRTEKTDLLQTTRETLTMLAGTFPGTPLEEFFDCFADYKTIQKYLSSFGQTVIDKAQEHSDNRIRARFNIGAAKTGRFSSSNPNLQQIPRDKELLGEATSVRSSFTAGLGRSLVSLDYSGIELRALALLSGDDQLLEDMIEGDVHLEVASKIAGRKIDKQKDKALRSAAKAVSFGIVYGSGAGGLSATMRCPETAAQAYIDFWSIRYAKAFQYRYDMLNEAKRTRYIRMADGGTIHMGKKPDLPKCANYPVQRAALSIMAAAITRHKNSLDAARSEGGQEWTRMLATIHDALIDEAKKKDAPACLEIMEADMIGGFLDVFPGANTDRLVEGGIGPNWGKLD